MSNRKSLEHLERACQEASMPSPSVSSKRHFLRIQRKHSLEFCLLILKGIPHISIMVLRDGGSNLGWTSLINHLDPIPSTCQKGSSSILSFPNKLVYSSCYMHVQLGLLLKYKSFCLFSSLSGKPTVHFSLKCSISHGITCIIRLTNSCNKPQGNHSPVQLFPQ